MHAATTCDSTIRLGTTTMICIAATNADGYHECNHVPQPHLPGECGHGYRRAA